MLGNKILIIGCPGSGKSYFSKELNEISNIPLYHLDCIFWKENWEHLSNEELLEEIKKIMINPKWIIDGNYKKSLEERVVEADTIFFLDIPVQECIEAEQKRRGTKRSDFPSFLEEKEDPDFVNYIKSFEINHKPYILELMKKYNDKKWYIFKSKEEKAIWLDRYVTYLMESEEYKKKYDEFFEEYKRLIGKDNISYLSAFHFEMSKKWANLLLEWILSGKKKATSSCYKSYEVENAPLPKVGDLSIVTDWVGEPKCIIKTTRVRLIPFKDMTYDIVKLEGEDENLTSWRKAHLNMFEIEGKELNFEFNENINVVFEEFEVVYRK